MAKSEYLSKTDEGKAQQFILFSDAIARVLAALGLTATDADLVQQAADATRFRALVDFTAGMQQAAKAWTAEKNYERDGGDTTAAATQAVPVLPAGFPALVAPGIVPRFRALVNRIKALKTYTATIGETLGIEGAEHTGPDLATVQPVFEAKISGNQVTLGWGWGWGGDGAFLDMILLQVDRGDGKGFLFLANDTTPGYTDSTPFPPRPPNGPTAPSTSSPTPK